MDTHECKRVLHVVSAMHRGGAETMIMNIYRNIDRNKVQFDFLVHSSIEGHFDDEIRGLGGNIIKCDSLGKLGIFKYIKQLRNIMIKNGPFHAVHAHTDIQSGVVALAAYLAGIKIRITHSHSTEIQQNITRKIKIYYKILSNITNIFSNNYCACSQKAGEFLYGLKNKDNVIVVNNGIELDRFININQNQVQKIKEQLSIKDTEIVIGHVGRFVDVKNHRFIVEIAKQLNLMNICYKLLLIGEGPLLKEIKRYIIQEKLEDNVYILGSRSDIPDILKLIDIFILPSKYEGIPLALIEAQASGRRCIISNNIDDDSDMGMGLILKKLLDEGAESWAKSIVEIYNKKVEINDIYIKEVFWKNGYDVYKNIETIYNLYQI